MIVRSSLCLIATIAFTIADDPASNSVLSVKRDPIDLEEMREKDFASSEDGGIFKRAPMGFQGMRGKKDSTPAVVDRELVPENVDERAPTGFQGNRNKKDNLNSDSEDTYVSGDTYEKRAYYKQDEHYKRAPMGFQGTRGKKSLEEILNEIDKRNTMGFRDTREPATYLFDYSEDYETRIPSMAVRGFQEDDTRNRKDEMPREWEKTTPMGFYGMRGEKTILDAIEQLEKRALMASFHGMRGKKDSFGNFLDYSLDPSEYAKRSTHFHERDASESPKRARMGFHGMRGKRDASQIYGVGSSYQGTNNDRGNKAAAYEITKRSPFRYIAVRGKKNPRWEFREKFVGVRGKKSSSLQHRSVF